MQITDAGVTVQPLTFHFGVLLLSGGATTGGTSGGTTSGGTTTGGLTTGGLTTGGLTTGGETTGSAGPSGTSGGGGIYPAAVGLLALFGGLASILASTPPQEQSPAVATGPAIIAPATAPAPAVVAATPAAPPGSQPGRPTPAPIVLAASAAQPGAPVAAASPPKKGPGVVLPYTGANLWLPIAAGSGLIGFGVWLRRHGQRFPEE